MKATHALQRAMERCPGICPGRLIRGLNYAVRTGDESQGVTYIAKVRRDDFCALFHFRLPDGSARYAVCSTVTGFVVTFLEPGRTIWTSRGEFMLGNDGLEAAPQEKTERNEQ